MSSQIEELGKLMKSQMNNVFNANRGITVELGTINKNMSLSVASLGNAIPKGDYMISLHLTHANLKIETENKDTITLPQKLRGLQAGDRVIVAWVGTEPVVADIVVSS